MREPRDRPGFALESPMEFGIVRDLPCQDLDGDDAVDRLREELADPDELEHRARSVVELAALCLQGSLLVRHAPAKVADAFCGTRLGDAGGRAYGTLPRGTDCAAIVERHRPKLESIG